MNRRHWLAIALALGIFAASGVGALADDEPVVIRWLMYGDTELFRQVLEPFHEQNPDIRVEFDVVNNFIESIVIRAAAGLLPDVTILNWGTLGLVDQGLYRDLTPYIERDGINLDDYVLQTNLATYKGQVIGLPWGAFTPLLFYNKHLFDEAGVGYPTPEWNWDDLEQAASALTRRPTGSEVQRWGLNSQLAEYEFGWRSFVGQAGGQFYNEDYTETLINSPEAVRAFEYLIDMELREIATPWNFDDKQITFRNWDIAMDLRHPSGPMSRFSGDPVDWEWGIEIAPMGEVRAASMNTLITGVTAASDHPEEAWRLVKYLGSVEAAKRIALLGRALPSHRGAYADPAFYQAWGDMVGADLTNLAYSMPIQMAHPYWVPVHLKESEIMGPVWDRVVRDLMRSGTSPRAFLEQTAARVNAIL